MNTTRINVIMTVGAAMGMVASFWQTLEKLTLLKNPDAILSCNLSPVFSCNSVLKAPQSALFGFPNSIMCLVLFTIFFASGLAGLTGGALSRGYRLGIQVLSLFTLGFAWWFLYQSTYAIGAICIFCLFCFTGLLLVNAAWLRRNAADLPLSKTGQRRLNRAIAQGADIFVWLLMAVVLAAMIISRFYL